MASKPKDSCVKKTALKVIVLGDSGVGKSTVVNIFRHGEYNPNMKATIGVDTFYMDVNVNGKPYILELRDVAGQERYRSICPSYYRGCDACILMFDLDNYVSYESISRWHQDISKYVPDSTERSRFPFIVVGNKRDLVVEDAPKVPAEDVQQWCTSQGIPYLETSYNDVRTVEGVMQMTLVEASVYNRGHSACHANATEPNKVKLESGESERRSKNCAGCNR